MTLKSLEEISSEIVKQGVVYALGLNGGYAKSYSNVFTDDDDVQIEIFCFWTSASLAQECVVEDWADYKVEEIQLSTFMETWCVGMSNENYGVGMNFDSGMSGVELDPLELLLALCEDVTKKRKSVKYEKFKSVGELRKYTEDALQYED